MIFLRETIEKDIEKIYEYIHLDYVKKYYPNEKDEQWESHRRWYAFLINSESYLLYTIIDKNEKFLGYVQYELDDEFAIINIYFIEEARGKGYSSNILALSMEELAHARKNTAIIFAYIMEENLPSIKAFEKQGFTFDGVEEYKGIEHRLYIKVVE